VHGDDPPHDSGLSAKDLSMLNIASAAALLRTDDLRVQIKRGLVNGVTADEVRDILGQVALHADSTLADCRRVAEQVLAEPGELPPGTANGPSL
jgi:alkylhydroperoxidase/carboxymuconolactone decarboxylase family protein YurZ